MAAITLNLLAEEQLAEKARARDPVKVAIAAGISLVALATASGAVLASFAAKSQGSVSHLQARLEELQAASSSPEEGSFRSLKATADDLLAINHSRVLYAPQLALIKDLIPTSVQLGQVSMALTLVSKKIEPEPAPVGGKVRRPPTPAPSERLLLRLEGRAYGGRPELEVDKFLQSLHANAAFSEQVEEIRLRSIASGVVGSESGLTPVPMATFVIECTYQEHKEPPAPKETKGPREPPAAAGAKETTQRKAPR